MSTPADPQDPTPSPARIREEQAKLQRPSAIQKQQAYNTEKPTADSSTIIARKPTQRRRSRPWLYLLSAITLSTFVTLAMLHPALIQLETLKDYLTTAIQSTPGAASNAGRSTQLTTAEEAFANNTEHTTTEQVGSALINRQLELADVLTSQLHAQPSLLGQLVALYNNILLQHPQHSLAKTELTQLREQSLERLASQIDNGDHSKAQQLADQLSTYFPELSDNATFRVLLKQINVAKPASTLITPDDRQTPLVTRTKAQAPEQTSPPARLPPTIGAVQARLADSTDHQSSPSSRDAKTLFVRFDYQGFTDNTTVLNLELQSFGKPGPITTVPIIVTGPRGTKTLQIHSVLDNFEAQRYQLDFILHGNPIGSYEFSL